MVCGVGGLPLVIDDTATRPRAAAGVRRGTARANELMGLLTVGRSAAVRHRQSQKCPHLGRGTGVTPRRINAQMVAPLPATTTTGLGVSLSLARRLRYRMV